MNAGEPRILTARTRTPFDLAASERETGGRSSLQWPVAPSEERAAVLGVADGLLEFVCALDDGDERDTAVLAAPVVLNAAATLGRAALAVERAEQSGIDLIGGPPEVAFLADGSSNAEAMTSMNRHPPVLAQWPVLRHVARTASWTPPWRLPRALLYPDATAVTHNPVLRAYARGGRLAVRFWQAERVLDAADVPPNPIVDDVASELAARLIGAVVSVLTIEESRKARLTLLLHGRVTRTVAEARAGLHAVSGWRGLPSEIWLGTAGRMPARMIAVAARRRGARTTSFDHGGGLFQSRLNSGKILCELAVVDRIVVATEAAAELAQVALPIPPPAVTREVLSGGGDPTFRRIRIKTPPRTGIRRVLYLPTTLRGFRTLTPPLLPDVIALDWQMRLAQILSRLPIELAVRPHPESLLPGLHHPAAQAFTPLVDDPFHRVVDMIDAFVFEYPNSTAFWEALCTDRPVVWIDLGTGNLSPETRAIVARRCRIVEGCFDDRNRPQVDEAALADAVCGDPSTVDPTEIRRLLAGDRP